MSPVVRLEEIDEFAPAKSISRHAIGKAVLDGVSSLHETKELEPFLREILCDPTETPHSSTEIADILTTHVTVNGAAQFAAFVNKGKATPKVTSRAVGHQLLKLRSISGLTLTVLLAVGDIHDDIKRDLAQVAQDMGADFLIIDAVDVARILIAHHRICPRDGHAYRDGVCPACGDTISQPILLSMPVYEVPVYEVVEDKDISTGPLKRAWRKVRTDPHYPKPVLRELVAEAIYEARTQQLYHSDQAEAYYQDREVGYVKLFVYLSGTDVQHNNPYCTATWLHPYHHEKHGVLRETKAETFGEIDIKWSIVYEDMREGPKGNTLSKAEWLRKLNDAVPKMDSLVDQARALLEHYEQGQLDAAQLEEKLSGLSEPAPALDIEVSEWGAAPLECSDSNNYFQGMVGQIFNTFVAFRPNFRRDVEWSRKLALVRNAVDIYAEDRMRLLHELYKIDRRTYHTLKRS